MQRELMQDLLAWKKKKDRKPLIINGARQVGKTWLAKEFGRCAYENVAYVNMDNNAAMAQLFEGDCKYAVRVNPFLSLRELISDDDPLS